MHKSLLFVLLLAAPACRDQATPDLPAAAQVASEDEAIARLLRQQRSECTIWQYSGSDSVRSTVACRRLYDARHRLISETYRGFSPTFEDTWVDGSTYSFYEDTLLRQQVAVYPNQDRSKVIHTYSPQGQLIRQEHLTFERRLKAGVDKGMGRSGGCIVAPEDYEPHRTWARRGVSTFAYDERGNKVEQEFQPPSAPPDRTTWAYDAGNRVTRQSFYSAQQLSWTEQYIYTPDGYSYTRTWFDAAGRPQHRAATSADYWPQYTFAVAGHPNRPVRQICTNEQGQTKSVITYAYDSQQRLIRAVARNGQGQPLTTHRYVYR
ncbi:hypothetical protein [Hymenobacter sp. B81]|uniref:hypothetical protein n=1 Tax=Hymenobacter sp. B81 TaxID=3344878 RepID=UPI0037DC1ADE